MEYGVYRTWPGDFWYGRYTDGLLDEKVVQKAATELSTLKANLPLAHKGSSPKQGLLLAELAPDKRGWVLVTWLAQKASFLFFFFYFYFYFYS